MTGFFTGPTPRPKEAMLSLSATQAIWPCMCHAVVVVTAAAADDDNDGGGIIG